MTIFAILVPAPNPTLSAAIAEAFKDDCLKLSETQWIVSSSATIHEVTAKAGIFDLKNPDTPSTGNAVVFATTSYFGRAPATVWDWIRSKLESQKNG
jgi:hypothetical protein